RIPHHTSIRSWFDGIAFLQVCWMVLAIALVRRTRLFGVLAIVFAISFVLTVVQYFLDSDTLALLFPWRTSAILVPISTAIILTRLIQKIEPWLTRRSRRQQIGIWVACGLVMVGLAAGGIAILACGWGYRTNPDEVPLLE